MKRSNLIIMVRLSKLVAPLSGYMFLAIFAGLLGHLAASFITVLGAVAIYYIITGTSIKVLTTFSCAILLLAFVRGFLRYAEQMCNHYIAFKLLALIRNHVFVALRKLCPAKLECRDKGDLISVITSDIEFLEVFYAHTLSPIAIAISFSVIMICFIGSYSLILGVIAAVSYFTIGVLVPVLTSKAGKMQGLKYRQLSGNMSAFILDSLRGISQIIQYGATSRRLEMMNDQNEQLASYELKMKTRNGCNMAVTGSLISLFHIITVIVASLLVSSKAMTLDVLLIPSMALISSFGPVVALANLGSSLENTFASANRVLDILDEEPITKDIIDSNRPNYNGANLDTVSFSYGNQLILDRLSLTIPDDSIIGIIGPSGSGKSTILKLLMRFWQIDKGRLQISNVNINEIDTTYLRSLESYVTQETHLFNDTIYNNLLIAKGAATEDEVVEACKKAAIHQFIQSLPDGYQSRVGELGECLSGGEKQRLGVARAFLHGGKLLLMDEPTSNLDSLNEAIILNSLAKEKSKKTIILVSHRHSTMRIADKVIDMQNINHVQLQKKQY